MLVIVNIGASMSHSISPNISLCHPFCCERLSAILARMQHALGCFKNRIYSVFVRKDDSFLLLTCVALILESEVIIGVIHKPSWLSLAGTPPRVLGRSRGGALHLLMTYGYWQEHCLVCLWWFVVTSGDATLHPGLY